jgi:hypothetical protein
MFWQILFAFAVIFVLTYDPKSRTLERFMVQPGTKTCEPAHFEAVQFGKASYVCPPPPDGSGVIRT